VGANYTHYQRRFASVADNAAKNSGAGSNLYWSIDIGLTHWIFWDSESWWSSSIGEQQSQLNWLQQDLAKANANRANVPWIVAGAHKLWYMDDTIDPTNTTKGSGGLVWGMLNDAGVDFHFSGHIHEYRRFLPQNPAKGQYDSNSSNADHSVYTDPAFMVPVVSGAPGDQEVNAVNPMSESARAHLHDARLRQPRYDPGWQTNTNNYGYGKLTIYNATHAHWVWTTAVPHVNSTAPDYSDDLWVIVKNHGPRV
jgi:hypothetical protein